MIEFVKHLTGACGEPHPNIWHALAGTPVIGYVYYRVRSYIKKEE
tara:strand:- start:240 stop:374 length:135 start_codon:yes stop_codon:yes gene_type:complete